MPPSPVAAKPAIRVAIVEDQDKIRQGLAVLISGTPGYVCTAVYASMEDALPGIGGAQPDVVLVDIGLPGISGIEGIRLLKQRHPRLLALVLTIYKDSDRIFDALSAGACGYLVKGTAPARLLESIGDAVEGGAPMSPQIARRVIAYFQPLDSSHLTSHERRILRLLVEGHHYQSAAIELGVSVNTIRFHLRSIYDKLQVHSKSEAVAKALRHRLVL